MSGDLNCESQRGITPRAIAKILESVARLRNAGWEAELEASFVEIYNESMRDLLAEAAPGRPGKTLENACIKHSPEGHTEVSCLFREALCLAGTVALLRIEPLGSTFVGENAKNSQQVSGLFPRQKKWPEVQ
jgi:hypothetical protein